MLLFHTAKADSILTMCLSHSIITILALRSRRFVTLWTVRYSRWQHYFQNMFFFSFFEHIQEVYLLWGHHNLLLVFRLVAFRRLKKEQGMWAAFKVISERAQNYVGMNMWAFQQTLFCFTEKKL